MFSKKVFACFVALGLISSPFFISFIEKAVAEEVLIAQSQSSLPTKEEIIQKGVSLGMKKNEGDNGSLSLVYQDYSYSISGGENTSLDFSLIALSKEDEGLEDLKLLVLEGNQELMTNPAIKTFAYGRGVDEETIANAIINGASNIVRGNCELSGNSCIFTEYNKNGDPEYHFWYVGDQKGWMLLHP